MLLARVLSLPFTTVAAINGHVVGAGVMLSLAHDYRFMDSERGWLRVPLRPNRIAISPAILALVRSKVRFAATRREVSLLSVQSSLLSFCICFDSFSDCRSEGHSGTRADCPQVQPCRSAQRWYYRRCCGRQYVRVFSCAPSTISFPVSGITPTLPLRIHPDAIHPTLQSRRMWSTRRSRSRRCPRPRRRRPRCLCSLAPTSDLACQVRPAASLLPAPRCSQRLRVCRVYVLTPLPPPLHRAAKSVTAAAVLVAQAMMPTVDDGDILGELKARFPPLTFSSASSPYRAQLQSHAVSVEYYPSPPRPRFTRRR